MFIIKSSKDKNMKKVSKGAIDYLFGRNLSEDHPRYSLQQMFNKFKETIHYGVEVETADFYNQGYAASIHFKDDAFIIVCDMKALTIESAILVDYELPEYEEFETISFDWEELRKRVEIFNSNLDIQKRLNSRSKAIKYIKDQLGVE